MNNQWRKQERAGKLNKEINKYIPAKCPHAKGIFTSLNEGVSTKTSWAALWPLFSQPF